MYDEENFRGPWKKDSKTLIHQKRGIYYEEEILAAFLAAVSCMAMSVTAMAAESTQEISAVLTADPTYTVTIPATVNMEMTEQQ